MCRSAAVALALAASSALAAHAQGLDEIDPDQDVSQTVVDLAGWVNASADNRGLPYAIIDKEAAQILVFGTDGRLRGMAPTLLGLAVGDDSAPGVGDRELKDIPKEDRTTPAGRFLAAYGPAAGGERVLWVDYATAISIHAVPDTTVSKREKRTERLVSKEPDDNRITHGCINVSAEFYDKVVSQLFANGGVFYVLPDTISVAQAFPGMMIPELLASR